MKIERLYLKNFGPFEEEEIIFKPSCVNLIVGKNATGKTQLAGALLYIVEGSKVIEIDEHNIEMVCIVEATISDNTATNKITRRINGQDYFIECSNITSTTYELKNISVGNDGIKNFNPYIIFSENIISKEIDIDISATKMIANMLSGNDRALKYWGVIQKRIEEFNFKKKNVITYSFGEQLLFAYISFLMNFLKAKVDQPIIWDTIAPGLDMEARYFLLSLLEIISQRTQVILLDFNDLENNKQSIEIIKELPVRKSFIRNRISYKYETKHFLFPPVNANFETTKIVFKYVMNSILSQEENRFIEFKEVKGMNPVNSILGLIDQYVVAYLNDPKVKQGHIIWGINNDQRKVVGVKLNLQQRDQLRREIPEKLNKILPSIPQSSYEINIENVVDSHNKLIDDLFIVEIIIISISSNYLYSTGNGDVYIKTDGGKKKLSMLDLQKELLFRNGMKINGV